MLIRIKVVLTASSSTTMVLVLLGYRLHIFGILLCLNPPLSINLTIPSSEHACASTSVQQLNAFLLSADRRRSAAATQAKKLFEGAEREVRQLRLACIHPQMTAYWRNLSAEMQLDSVSIP